MELSIDTLKPIIDLLKTEGVRHFKFGALELHFDAVPGQTVVPPVQTTDQLKAEEENMLFYSAGS